MCINPPIAATISITGRHFMENTHSEISQQRRRSIMEQLWLTYYNDTLYEKGVITEDERNKMRIKIKSRTRQLESR